MIAGAVQQMHVMGDGVTPRRLRTVIYRGKRGGGNCSQRRLPGPASYFLRKKVKW